MAEQLAVVPPYWPVQLQLQGPEPVTVGGVPVVEQRLLAGALVKMPPFALPQAPFVMSWAKLAT